MDQELSGDFPNPRWSTTAPTQSSRTHTFCSSRWVCGHLGTPNSYMAHSMNNNTEHHYPNQQGDLGNHSGSDHHQDVSATFCAKPQAAHSSHQTPPPRSHNNNNKKWTPRPGNPHSPGLPSTRQTAVLSRKFRLGPLRHVVNTAERTRVTGVTRVNKGGHTPPWCSMQGRGDHPDSRSPPSLMVMWRPAHRWTRHWALSRMDKTFTALPLRAALADAALSTPHPDYSHTNIQVVPKNPVHAPPPRP